MSKDVDLIRKLRAENRELIGIAKQHIKEIRELRLEVHTNLKKLRKLRAVKSSQFVSRDYPPIQLAFLPPSPALRSSLYS
jgi:hypothetical protein